MVSTPECCGKFMELKTCWVQMDLHLYFQCKKCGRVEEVID